MTQEDICRVVLDPDFTIVESYKVDWAKAIAEMMHWVIITDEMELS
jgi:hypothetical protein